MKLIYKLVGIGFWVLASFFAFKALTAGYGSDMYRAFLWVAMPLMSLLSIYFFFWGRNPGHIVRFFHILLYLTFSMLVYFRNSSLLSDTGLTMYIAVMLMLPAFGLWFSKKHEISAEEKKKYGSRINYFDIYFK